MTPAVMKTIIPSLLGAAGALAATMMPGYYHAVCGALPLSGISIPLGG